jgi:hypothetical protein
VIRRFRRLLCRWLGRTFMLPDKVNFTGGLLHLLAGAACTRCGQTYEDLWNQGWRP